jgi:transposase
MKYLRGPDRSQVQLLPPCLDDYAQANSAVRFLEAYVESLDLLKLGFERAQPPTMGRPPYHPADLLKLYLYGYLNRIRSSRRLEAEATRNLELMWLLRGITPDFKTIADFRKDNVRAFKPLFKTFNLLCRKEGLFGAELVAIDGSKFKAVNNIGQHYTQKQLEELVAKIEKRIEEYLGQLDQEDAQAEGVAGKPSAESLRAKIDQLQKRAADGKELLQEMGQAQVKEISLTDRDSRGQKKVGVGYNVQIAVDAKHHLIAEPEVVQDANDRKQLSPLASAAKKELQVENLRAVADGGYHEAEQLEACEQAGLETYVSTPATTSGQSRGGQQVYPKERFKYDAQSDSYECPAGQQLKRGYQGDAKGKERIYYYNVAACGGCACRSQCTQGDYRKLWSMFLARSGTGGMTRF